MKSKLIMTAVASAFCVSAYAESLSVVGSWSSLPLYNQYEKPYWTEVLPKASKLAAVSGARYLAIGF